MEECTLVTAYYNFKNKKHNNTKYEKWIKNFLENTNSKIVIFTDSEETANFLIKYRTNFLDKTKIIIEEVSNLYCYKYNSYWNKDLDRDHEKAYHNQNLYIIWNEKSMFMYKAYKENYFNTEFYAWIDIGMVREDNYISLLNNYPSKERLSKLKKEKVYILLIENFSDDEIRARTPTEIFRYKNRIGGGMILCSRYNIEKWTQEYYNMLNNFMNNDLFAGKDQSIMANLYIKYKNDFIELVVPKQKDFSIIDNIWFYMLYFLSEKFI